MLSIGDHFDRYVVESVLGQGGMGIVYRALDPRLGRRVALKVVALGERGSTPDGAARLLREARAAAALDHPNAVAIFDVGEVAGEPYLAMELVPGRTLREVIGDPSVPIAERVAWLADVARALAAAHRVRLVHRDVKPENVMVRDDGVVKVLDFGIARRASGAIDPNAPTASVLATITAEGVAVGTPLYMAPEQIRGAPVDARSDQFSWGVVAYELLSGKSPWGSASDLLALAVAISNDPARPLMENAAGVSRAVADVVMRALRKAPGERFPSMGPIVQALDAERTGKAAPVATPSMPAPRRARVVAGAAIAIALAGGAIAFASRGGPAPATSAAPSASASAPVLLAIPPAMPTAGKPEAIEAYREALVARRGGEGSRYRQLLYKAVDLDRTLSEALLRIALSPGQNRDAEARDFVARAGARRDALLPRDAALLRATEALYARDPVDRAGYLRALAAAVAQFPRDAELRHRYAEGLADDGRIEEAERELDQLAAIDPDYAAAWATRCDLADGRGDAALVRRTADECVRRFPRAIDCLSVLESIDANDGRCDALEDVLRREIAVDPSSLHAYQHLTDALISQGRTKDVVDAVFEQALAIAPAEPRDAIRAGHGWQIEVAYGRFDVADEMARAYIAAHPRDLAMDRMGHFRRLEIADEVGDRVRGAALVREAMRREVMWGSPAAFYRGNVLRWALDFGVLDRAAFDREAAAWRARVPALLGLDDDDAGSDADTKRRFTLWLSAYASTAVTRDDVDDALRRYDAIGLRPAPNDPSLYAADIGALLFRGGRVDEAIPLLRRAAADCSITSDPGAAVRSSLLLGEALESKGDAAGACAAYAKVLERWGGSARSRTAAEARARAAKLGCNRAK